MSIKAALRLTRPRQWPILTAQLLVGVLLFFAMLDTPNSLVGLSDKLTWLPLIYGWFIWVILLNGGTLAFNSAYDRDTGPVAYLNNPPTPPANLALIMLLAMVLGALAGWLLIGSAFGCTVGACLVLSVLYSHPLARWKAIPGLDLLVNILGYGAGTTLAGLLIGWAMFPANFPPESLFFMAGFGLLFGSLYPLTQIYQVQEDRLRGDRTLSSTLGIKPALAVSVILGFGALATLLAGIYQQEDCPPPIFFMGGISLWLIHLIRWWLRTERMSNGQHEKGMYQALWLWAVVDITLLAEMLLR